MALPSAKFSHAEQLLPNVLQNRANKTPNAIFAKYPRSPTTYTEGFREVKYFEFVNAINRVAWLLEENFGSAQDFPAIAYYGPSDLRYSIVVVAAVKAGFKVS